MQEKNYAYLNEKHIQRMFKAFKDYIDMPHFAAVVTNEELLGNNASMNVHHYVKRHSATNSVAFSQRLADLRSSSEALDDSMNHLFLNRYHECSQEGRTRS